MKTLIFNAPPHHVLDEGGELIHGGGEFSADDDRAEELLTQPNLSVVEKPAEIDLTALTRRQLDEIAAERGIDASALPNRDAVVAALTGGSTVEGMGDAPSEATHHDADS